MPGIASNCAACHVPAGTATSFAGIGAIVGMPPTSPTGSGSHMPTGTSCETCHLASLPTGLIAASATKTAPGTAFATPAPGSAQIHTGITSGCTSCHEASYVWMGVSAYPISPSFLSPGAQYTGFQTRPRTAAGTYNVADAAHPTTGDCAQCHGNTSAFTGADKPANHIPYASGVNCDACHISTDYSVMPTLAAIHANAPSTTSNCAQCHGSAASSFAIPAANFTIVGLPSNHLPTAASCETCHVGAGSSITSLPVGNGAKFSGSLMSHAGIASNCAACHVPAGTTAAFAGIGAIVGQPATSPMGASSHIPVGNACETCHLASAADRADPGVGRQDRARHGLRDPRARQRTDPHRHHLGLHELPRGQLCVDGRRAPIRSRRPRSQPAHSTPASRRGHARRPAPTTWPTQRTRRTGDCAQCHGNTSAFTGVDKPANHIPYSASATCNACHTGTDYSVMPTLAAIHANAPSTTSNCAQCHGSAAASFAIPAANFSIVGLPSNHLPTSASCETCHVGAGSSITSLPVGNGAKFSGSLMSHAGITNNCSACHTPAGANAAFAGISAIVGMPATSPMGSSAHIPSGTTCETCHLASLPTGLIAASATKTAPGTAFATPAPGSAQIHTGITSGCTSCHEASYVWMGVERLPDLADRR